MLRRGCVEGSCDFVFRYVHGVVSYHSTYPSSLTDGEWFLLEPLLPSAKPSGRPRRQNLRSIVDAILYVLRGGIAWRFLPIDFPKWKTVYDYFWKWRSAGV